MVLWLGLASWLLIGIGVKIEPLCALLVIMPLFVNRECSSSYDERIMGFVGRHTLDVYFIHYFFITTLDVMNDRLRGFCSVTSIQFSLSLCRPCVCTAADG